MIIDIHRASAVEAAADGESVVVKSEQASICEAA